MTPATLRRGFGPIYRKVTRCGSEVSPFAKLVLLNLLERQGQNSTAWPGQKLIASDLAISERVVWDALKELQALGWLTVHRRGLGMTNAYVLDIERLVAWAEHRVTSESSLAPDAAQEPHEERILPIKDLPKRSLPKERNAAARSVHRPIGPDYLDELQAEHPTVNVADVYEDAQNRAVWDGYKDKRRALLQRVKWAESQADRRQGNGNRGNGQRPHRELDEYDQLARAALGD